MFSIGAFAQPCLVKFTDLKEVTEASTCNYKEFEYTLNNSASGFKWIYGDGNSCTCHRPKNFYKKNDTFQLIGIVYDVNGCADSVFKDVIIHCDNPCDLSDISIYSADTLSYSCNEIEFNALKSPNTKQLTWYFGDGDSSKNAFDVHTYQTNGLYSVYVVAIDSIGCSDTAFLDLNINCATFETPCSLKIDSISLTKSNNCKIINYQIYTNQNARVYYLSVNQSSFTKVAKKGFYEFLDTGVYDLCVISQDSLDCKDTLYKTVKINCPNVFSTSTIKQHDFRIYPIPAKQTLNLEIQKPVYVELFDVYGRLILELQTLETITPIDIQSLQSGVYVLKIDHLYTKQFTKE